MADALTDFDKLWDYSNPAETGKKFRALLPLAEKQKDRSYLIELMTQIARTEGLQMKFEDAHKTLDKTMKMMKPEHIRPRIRYMLERGRAYNSSKVFDKAGELFLAAFQQAEKYNEDNYAIDAAHMMGIVEKGEESLKWNEIAIHLAEETEDLSAKGWLGSLYNNTGWSYHDMGEFERALEMFQRNVIYYTEKDPGQYLGIAKWCVGRTLRSLDRIDEALKMQENLIEWYKQTGLDESGYVFEEIGECMLVLNRANEAKPYFSKAYEILSKDIWLAANEKERLERLDKLGE